MNELCFALDTQILIYGHGGSRNEAREHHVRLIGYFKNHVCLALDNRGLIEGEYHKETSSESDARRWLAAILLERARRFPLGTIPRRLLEKIRLHRHDQKWVRVAMNMDDGMRVIVSEDHRMQEIKPILWREFGIRVLDGLEACQLVEANLSGN
jgi:hypothetical protein